MARLENKKKRGIASPIIIIKEGKMSLLYKTDESELSTLGKKL